MEIVSIMLKAQTITIQAKNKIPSVLALLEINVINVFKEHTLTRNASVKFLILTVKNSIMKMRFAKFACLNTLFQKRPNYAYPMQCTHEMIEYSFIVNHIYYDNI
jgi:hypothetical protein